VGYEKTVDFGGSSTKRLIEGGVIGGLEQNGAYKLDCRFNSVLPVSMFS